MSRPAESGQYTVPPEILALKPKEFPCIVKAISAPSKSVGSVKHYYVYELLSVPDAKRPGKTKNNSGPCLGKIEGGMFCPNKTGIQRLGGGKGPNPLPQHGKKDASESLSDSTGREDTLRMTEAAANLFHVLRLP